MEKILQKIPFLQGYSVKTTDMVNPFLCDIQRFNEIGSLKTGGH